jgi:hypothetical protein
VYIKVETFGWVAVAVARAGVAAGFLLLFVGVQSVAVARACATTAAGDEYSSSSTFVPVFVGTWIGVAAVAIFLCTFNTAAVFDSTIT